MSTLASRIAELVNAFHAGSVNAAARDIGIPQATLARIVAGAVHSPRSEALERIADFYDVSVDWLLRGRGEQRALPTGLTAREQLRWAKQLRAIGVSEQAFYRMMDLSETLASAPAVLIKESGTVTPQIQQALDEAGALAVRAWTTMLEAVAEDAKQRGALRDALDNKTLQDRPHASGLPLRFSLQIVDAADAADLVARDQELAAASPTFRYSIQFSAQADEQDRRPKRHPRPVRQRRRRET